MKLFYFNTSEKNGVRDWEMGCNWIFFLILAAVVALVWWLV